MRYKKYLHHNLIKILSGQDILFYHTVKYRINENISAKFERDKSLFINDNNISNSLFIEGFALIKKLYGKEQSLIETLFNKLIQKYSFHCDIEAVETHGENYLNLELDGRDVYIKGGFCPLKYSSLPSKTYHSSSLDELFEQYWQINLDFETVTEIVPSIKKEIRKNILHIFNKEFQPSMVEVLELLLIFLYPSVFNPIKKFSVYVITSFENQLGEITNGGLSVFYNPHTLTTKLTSLRNKISYVTAQWTNYESTESLISIIQQKSLYFAITTILVDSFAHNVAAHSLSALEWWFKRRADAIDTAYFEYWKKEMDKIADIKTFKQEYKNWLNGKRAALQEEDRTYFADYINKLKNPNENTEVLPVSVSHVLYPLLRFLRDKAVFWSGVTRDYAFGGEMYSWFDLLYYEFAYNPLFLGTIAFSEGITKLNIWLKVMDSEEKTLTFQEEGGVDTGIPTHQPFVSIDLSESGILQNNDTHNEYLQSGIAQYRLLRHDEKYFKEWEKLLSGEAYKVFVPNGKVGIHAFLTLIENALRNVKHYRNPETLKQMREKGIDIHISLSPISLNPQQKKEDFPLFRVGVRLNHEVEFTEKEGKALDEVLFYNALESIVKDSGEARLGGNSQDKICASMLLNNRFSEVETIYFDDKGKQERSLFYYPWIYFCMTDTSNGSETEQKGKFTFSPNWNQRIEYAHKGYSLKNVQEKIRVEYKNQREQEKLQNPTLGQGAIVKYFYMWKGETVKKAGAIQDVDNLSRFKFLRAGKQNPKNEIFREVESESDNIEELYVEWLSKWVGDFGIEIWDETIKGKNFEPIIYAKFKSGLCNFTWEDIDESVIAENKVELRFQHAIQDKIDSNQNIVGIRSHGIWLSKYFKNNDRYNYSPKKLDFYEMVEILGTKILISDNRVAERVAGRKLYEDASLNLKVISELKEEWEVQKKGIFHYHLVILHLSFIEAMDYKEGNIAQFIEDSFDMHILPPNFRLVITSGRGRSEWMRDIVENKRYNFVTFKPIESILEAIENGLSIKDDFQIKYNLVKLFLK